MQIGDNILCKKSLIHNDLEYYTKDKIYDIISITGYSIRISDDRTSSSEFRLYTPNNDEYKLEDYFCTNIKDLRKQKLEKLSNVKK